MLYYLELEMISYVIIKDVVITSYAASKAIANDEDVIWDLLKHIDHAVH